MIIEHDTEYKEVQFRVTRHTSTHIVIIVHRDNVPVDVEILVDMTSPNMGRVDQRLKRALMTLEEQLDMRLEQFEAIDIARNFFGVAQSMGFPVKGILMESVVPGCESMLAYLHHRLASIKSAAISADRALQIKLQIQDDVVQSIIERFGVPEKAGKST